MKPQRITYQSRKAFENTDEYKSEKCKLVKEIHAGYQKLLQNEKNFFKQWVLRFRKHREIKKRIAALNPTETLFQHNLRKHGGLTG